MAGREAVKTAFKQVKPILSTDKEEARKRVLNLYRAWYRQVPYIGEFWHFFPLVMSSLVYIFFLCSTVKDFDIPKSEKQVRDKLKEEFLKNKDVKDIRVIDMLVIKGQMDLKESVNIWKQKGHIMKYWQESVEQKPTDFLSKFFSGTN